MNPADARSLSIYDACVVSDTSVMSDTSVSSILSSADLHDNSNYNSGFHDDDDDDVDNDIASGLEDTASFHTCRSSDTLTPTTTDNLTVGTSLSPSPPGGAVESPARAVTPTLSADFLGEKRGENGAKNGAENGGGPRRLAFGPPGGAADVVQDATTGFRYDYDDFTRVDHRLKLQIMMQHFENDEELRLLVKVRTLGYSSK